MKEHFVLGWAVVPDDKPETTFCFTSAPDIIGGGTIWEIYKTEADAQSRCDDVVFARSAYHVVRVEIAVSSN